jgi:hypothetical protein
VLEGQHAHEKDLGHEDEPGKDGASLSALAELVKERQEGALATVLVLFHHF